MIRCLALLRPLTRQPSRAEACSRTVNELQSLTEPSRVARRTLNELQRLTESASQDVSFVRTVNEFQSLPKPDARADASRRVASEWAQARRGPLRSRASPARLQGSIALESALLLAPWRRPSLSNARDPELEPLLSRRLATMAEQSGQTRKVSSQ